MRRVEPAAEQDGLGNASKHEEGRLDGGQLAKQVQVIRYGSGGSLALDGPGQRLPHWRIGVWAVHGLAFPASA